MIVWYRFGSSSWTLPMRLVKMTVFPAPVAKLIPRRRLPSEMAFRHASTQSSWYGRSGRAGEVERTEGGIKRVISLIFGGLLGFEGLRRGVRSEEAAMTVSVLSWF